MHPYASPGVTKGWGMELWDTRGRPEKDSWHNAWKGVKTAVRFQAKREIRDELDGIDPRYPKRVGYRSWKGRVWHGGNRWHNWNQYPFPYSFPEPSNVYPYRKHPALIEKEFEDMLKTWAERAYESRLERLKNRIPSHPWLQDEYDSLNTRHGRLAFIEAHIATQREQRTRHTGDNKLWQREREQIQRDHWVRIWNNMKKKKGQV
jgi:hypothetical protein